jgi:hypothetical protein
MDRKTFCAALAPALLLLACQQQAAPPANDTTPAPDTTTPMGNDVAPESAAPTNAVDDGKPDLAPPKLTPDAERGETGARDVLLSFARAIELREFGQAWDLLSPADHKKWPRPKFAAMFADLGKITVAVPTGTMEGAAGSSYYTAPVTITANDKDGRPVRIEGEAVVRRVNDVPGANLAQLRWHFERLTLNRTH